MLPGVKINHGAVMPASATEGTGLPDVVILNLSGLPAATVTEFADVMVAVLDEGITAFEGADAAPEPSALVATTVKVVDMPFNNPVTTQLVVVVVQVTPRADRTTYPVMVEPSSEGAVQVTVA